MRLLGPSATMRGIVALSLAIWTPMWMMSPRAHGASHSSSPHGEHHGMDQHTEKNGQGHAEDDGHGSMAGHAHPVVPDDYRSAHVPASVWTDATMVARGKEIYQTRCAVCHGAQGDGKGPAAIALPLKPPDLRDTSMINVMRGSYWFWRVSEGGQVEPFRSQGSTMPAWKTVLSVEDRWAVIAYQHAFSGHHGPHVTSEHPQMGVPDGGGATHATSPTSDHPGQPEHEH